MKCRSGNVSDFIRKTVYFYFLACCLRTDLTIYFSQHYCSIAILDLSGALYHDNLSGALYQDDLFGALYHDRKSVLCLSQFRLYDDK